jgi:uncharacterized protein (DUF1684 family)
MWRLAIAVLLGFSLASAAGSGEGALRAYRAAREKALRAPEGWLSVVGLEWLRPGENLVRGVKFRLAGGKVTAEQDGVARELAPDSADHLALGTVKLFLIQRGDRFGIRVKDAHSKSLAEFAGLRYFPEDPAWRITAKFVPAPRRIPILNVLGQTEPMACPGYAEFTVAGRKLRLYPVLEAPGAKTLFFIFRDLTSGKETYGAGRFLYTELPSEGRVVLDFNRAQNPPCAFTAYATCPLPPRENRLPIRVPAGELNYGGH